MRNLVILPIFALLLSSCGGDNPTSGSQPGSADTKHLTRTTKTQASDYESAVQELYVAYFGRPADPNGLTNFENALLAANAPTDVEGISTAYATNTAIQSLVDSFGNSKESQTLYGNGNATAFVTAVFQNVLGRQPQASGISFWAGAIANGSLSQGDAALAIMAGGLTNTSAQGLIDAALIENRIAVASDFTAALSAAGDTASYAGSTAAATARSMLGTVDSTTDVSAFSATIDSTIAALASAGTANTYVYYSQNSQAPQTATLNADGSLTMGSLTLTNFSFGNSASDPTGTLTSWASPWNNYNQPVVQAMLLCGANGKLAYVLLLSGTNDPSRTSSNVVNLLAGIEAAPQYSGMGIYTDCSGTFTNAWDNDLPNSDYNLWPDGFTSYDYATVANQLNGAAIFYEVGQPSNQHNYLAVTWSGSSAFEVWE